MKLSTLLALAGSVSANMLEMTDNTEVESTLADCTTNDDCGTGEKCGTWIHGNTATTDPVLGCILEENCGSYGRFNNYSDITEEQ